MDNPLNVIEVESYDRRIIIINSAEEDNGDQSPLILSDKKSKDESWDEQEISE